MVSPEALHQRTNQGGRVLGVRDRRVGKGGTNLSIDVVHPELLRDFREIGGPFDAARGFELSPRLVGQFKEGTESRVVDDKGHLRPILGSLANVPGGCVLPDARKLFLVVRWQEALVDAENVDGGLHRFLIEGVHQLLIIEPPGELRWAQWITDRVGLPRFWLVHLDRLVDLLDPARLLWRDHRVRQEAPRTREVVDYLSRSHDLLVRKEPP